MQAGSGCANGGMASSGPRITQPGAMPSMALDAPTSSLHKSGTALDKPTDNPRPNASDKNDLPKKAIYRLSIYHRCLEKLAANQVATVSSHTLARAAGVNASQIRKDIAHLGQYGTRGLGYPVETLMRSIRETLGRERFQPVVLIGAGNLGSALLRYQGFEKEGFQVIAAFDADPEAAIRRGIGVPVLHESELETFIARESVKLAILCVPAGFAQSMANRLAHAGIHGILNFSPVVLDLPKDVTVNNVDLALELEHLGYFIR